MGEYLSLLNNFPASLFVVERIENPVNSNCAVQQPSVYLFTSIYEYAVKFCFYDDHAPLSAIYVRT